LQEFNHAILGDALRIADIAHNAEALKIWGSDDYTMTARAISKVLVGEGFMMKKCFHPIFDTA
jgi:hypothetical protein